MLTGSDSVAVVREATDRAAAAIPHAEIRMLQGHGHFAHKTDPAMVSAIIQQFIAQYSTRTTPLIGHLDRG